jgi:NinB protein
LRFGRSAKTADCTTLGFDSPADSLRKDHQVSNVVPFLPDPAVVYERLLRASKTQWPRHSLPISTTDLAALAGVSLRAFLILSGDPLLDMALDIYWDLGDDDRLHRAPPAVSAARVAEYQLVIAEMARGAWAPILSAASSYADFIPSLDGQTFVAVGQSTAALSVAEMADLIESIFAFGAEREVKWSDYGTR